MLNEYFSMTLRDAMVSLFRQKDLYYIEKPEVKTYIEKCQSSNLLLVFPVQHLLSIFAPSNSSVL